jgi:hypothetical protein
VVATSTAELEGETMDEYVECGLYEGFTHPALLPGAVLRPLLVETTDIFARFEALSLSVMAIRNRVVLGFAGRSL